MLQHVLVPHGIVAHIAAGGVQEALYQAGVEVPVKVHAGRLYLRISTHVYNVAADYAALARAVDSLAADGTSSGSPT